MKPDFILISGVAIAVAHIAYVDFRQPDSVTVHLDSNSVSTSDEAEIARLKDLFLPEPEDDSSEEFAPTVE